MTEVNPQRAGNGQHEEGLVALHRRDARSRLIIEQALDAIITLDANGHITDWNPQP
ncbi:MAG: PAS domain S-box protein, partial [Candidatus Binatia bacterium]